MNGAQIVAEILKRETGAAERIDRGARDHDLSAAASVHPPARKGRRHAHHQERRGKSAVDDVAAPAEIRGDLLAEPADQIVGRAPRDQLGKPEGSNDPARDHRYMKKIIDEEGPVWMELVRSLGITPQ